MCLCANVACVVLLKHDKLHYTVKTSLYRKQFFVFFKCAQRLFSCNKNVIS